MDPQYIGRGSGVIYPHHASLAHIVPTSEPMDAQSQTGDGGHVDASVLVPVLNEERHISDSVAAMQAQRFDGALEFLFMDGRSEDRTKAILEELAASDRRIRVFDNPGRSSTAGLNVGLRHARGDYIVRMDAHTFYPEDYIARGVERLRRGDVVWVAGPQVPHGVGRWSRRVALALRSLVGRGRAARRGRGERAHTGPGRRQRRRRAPRGVRGDARILGVRLPGRLGPLRSAPGGAPADRAPAERVAAPVRLAVYTDYVYRREGDAVYAERAFALFLVGLAPHVERLVIVGRLDPRSGASHYRLPDAVEFVPLPHYSSLIDA